MMKEEAKKYFNNLNIYGMDESILASGYPKSITLSKCLTGKDMDRAKILGTAKGGSGHDCFLKGIVVQFDLSAPQYIWLQLGRYHFFDIVSSQSKMHKLLDMDIYIQTNRMVDIRVIEVCRELIEAHKQGLVDFETVMSNVPMGLELTARITTNYLQLKTIVAQRKGHKLGWWREFTDACDNELLHFTALTNKEV